MSAFGFLEILSVLVSPEIEGICPIDLEVSILSFS